MRFLPKRAIAHFEAVLAQRVRVGCHEPGDDRFTESVEKEMDNLFKD